jgi:hypothetical protein
MKNPKRSYLLWLGFAAVLCLRCGFRSYNSNDIRELYCGHCHQFHVRAPGRGVARVEILSCANSVIKNGMSELRASEIFRVEVDSLRLCF